jgi:DNA-binding winged helix-turn-helix (wHTH) protein
MGVFTGRNHPSACHWSQTMPRVIHFDCFEVDLDAGHLLKRGMRIRLCDQPFQVLALLLENPGELVTRDEMRRRLWRDEVFVDFDNSLNIAIARIRTALVDPAKRPRFIETLPKRGVSVHQQCIPAVFPGRT